ncbi:MAG TPA: META domain-containing protein [Actinomycetota bacterium]|nr:META domain-containing protein [Actinomycetota bacterium]
MRRVGALLASGALVTMLACGSDGSTSGGAAGGDLTGVTWLLDEASMMTLVDTVPAKARVDIAFDGSELHGRAACNSYGGGYEADTSAGTLSFSDLFSTEMACEARLMDLESAYLAALGDVTGYQVVGDRAGLVLTGGQTALTFAPESPVQALPLEGTAWTLTTIAEPNSQAVSSTVAGTVVTATFDGGSMSGSGGCNTYNATADISGDELVVGPIASTLIACAGGVGRQESAYFAALEAVGLWSIEGDQLTLSDENGQMLLQFSGRPVR